MEQISRFLGLLSPCFCLASVLTQGDTSDSLLDIIDDLIERNLKVVDPAVVHFNAADERELEFQRELLAHCLVQDTGPDRTGQPKVGVEKRRREAEDILEFFNAPWTDEWGIAHICRRGCCFDPEVDPNDRIDEPCACRAESVKRAQRLLRHIFAPPINEPAANKYTKIDPCIKSVALITWTFGLLRKAIGKKLGKKDSGPAAAGNILEQVDPESAIGIPKDASEHYKQMGNIKVNRAHTFLSHGYAKYLALVWLAVTLPIMILHYQLFKHGTFYSRRDHREDISIFDFVGPISTNPVAKVITALVTMLLDPLGAGRIHLKLMRLKLGDEMQEWPLRVVRALHFALLLGISVLWRKLFIAYQAYPWALAPAFDDARSDEERRTTLEQFFDAASCCLDQGLGRQLRKAFPSRIDVYDGTPLASCFLKTLFQRLVVTSTQVELQFSSMTGLTNTRNKRLGLAGLAAKAMNAAYNQQVVRWREFMTKRVKADTARARPVWTKTRNKGAKTGAFDLYKKEVSVRMKANGKLDGVPNADLLHVVTSEALKLWPLETEATRARYEDQARASREDATANMPPLKRALTQESQEEQGEDQENQEGPLGFASLDGPFPALPSMVEKYQQDHGFAKSVERFRKAHEFYTAPLDGFPKEIEEERTCNCLLYTSDAADE